MKTEIVAAEATHAPVASTGGGSRPTAQAKPVARRGLSTESMARAMKDFATRPKRTRYSRWPRQGRRE